MNSLTWIQEVKLHNLIYKASIPGHDHCPSASCSGHSCDVKTLLPLLVYPLEGKRVTYFVGLLCILCSWRLKVSSNLLNICIHKNTDIQDLQLQKHFVRKICQCLSTLMLNRSILYYLEEETRFRRNHSTRQQHDQSPGTASASVVIKVRPVIEPARSPTSPAHLAIRWFEHQPANISFPRTSTTTKTTYNAIP